MRISQNLRCPPGRAHNTYKYKVTGALIALHDIMSSVRDSAYLAQQMKTFAILRVPAAAATTIAIAAVAVAVAVASAVVLVRDSNDPTYGSRA